MENGYDDQRSRKRDCDNRRRYLSDRLYQPDGQEDETELDAYNMTELDELYREFCKENGFRQNTVTYVER